MKHKKHRSHEIDKEGYFRTYPSLHETKEKSVFRRLLRILQRRKKGH